MRHIIREGGEQLAHAAHPKLKRMGDRTRNKQHDRKRAHRMKFVFAQIRMNAMEKIHLRHRPKRTIHIGNEDAVNFLRAMMFKIDKDELLHPMPVFQNKMGFVE